MKILRDAETERLALLAEECGEVVRAVGKVLRHGYDQSSPFGGPDNRAGLAEEIGDVLVAVEMLLCAGDVDRESVRLAALGKAERVEEYLHHSSARDVLKRLEELSR